MVKFGKRLGGVQSKTPEDWKYIDYAYLKYQISRLISDKNADEPDRQFREDLNEKCGVVNESYKRIEAALLKKADELKVQRSEQPDATATADASLSLLKELGRARDFVSWNYIGVMKIVKKFNKNMQGREGHTDIDSIEVLGDQHFYRSRVIAELMTSCEAALAATPAWNLIPAQSIKCPICMDILDRPVVLACTHRFCHDCLARACDQGADSCPVCRRPEKSLDPNQYHVDDSLTRLLASPNIRAKLESPVVNNNIGDAWGASPANNTNQRSSSPAELAQAKQLLPPVAMLGERALAATFADPSGEEGWVVAQSYLGLRCSSELLSHYDRVHNVATTRVVRECACVPISLFNYLRKVQTLHPFYQHDTRAFSSAPPAKLPMKLPTNQPCTYDSHVVEGYETGVHGLEYSVVLSALLNLDTFASLVMFEYRCQAKKYEGPWVAVIARVEQVPDNPRRARVTLVLQLDLNSCFVDNQHMHACNLLERMVQDVAVADALAIATAAAAPTPPANTLNTTDPTPAVSAGDTSATVTENVPDAQRMAHTAFPSDLPPPPPPKRIKLEHGDSSSRCLYTTTYGAGMALQHISTAPEKLPRRRVDQMFDRFGRIMWTDELHEVFLQAIEQLGIFAARPKAIHKFMNVENLTVEHIKSHLQMYRSAVKAACKTRCADAVSVQIVRNVPNTNLTPFLDSMKDCSEEEVAKAIELVVHSAQPSSDATASQQTSMTSMTCPHLFAPPPHTLTSSSSASTAPTADSTLPISTSLPDMSTTVDVTMQSDGHFQSHFTYDPMLDPPQQPPVDQQQHLLVNQQHPSHNPAAPTHTAPPVLASAAELGGGNATPNVGGAVADSHATLPMRSREGFDLSPTPSLGTPTAQHGWV